MFLTKLPAEVRNCIYEFVLEKRDVLEENEEEETEEEMASEKRGDESSNPPEAPSTNEGSNSDVEFTRTPPSEQRHPLSLLLTCRRINVEATLLAYANHTFTIHNRLFNTFHDLLTQTYLLSPSQISAITSLAYNMPLHRGSLFLAGALVLFPAVTRLRLRIERTRDEQGGNPHANAAGDASKSACVAPWLWSTLNEVREGKCVGGWQAGQKWELEWPQMDEEIEILSKINQTYSNNGDDVFVPGARAIREAHLRDLGVEQCACGCGVPCWNRVWLVQESGRRVRLDVVYYGDWVKALVMKRKMEFARHKVKLLPGVERLPVRSLSGEVAPAGEGMLEMRGFGWDGKEREEAGWGMPWGALALSGEATRESVGWGSLLRGLGSSGAAKEEGVDQGNVSVMAR